MRVPYFTGETPIPLRPQPQTPLTSTNAPTRTLGAPRTVDELSPGERTRAGLALLQACGTNVLVLDEPTNHLDLAAIEQLEQALDTYDGALLLVTHDRRMLQNVRLDRTWLVDDGRVSET